MGIFSGLIGLVVSVATTVFDVARKAAAEIVGAATEAYNQYQRERERSRMPPAERQKEEARDRLREVNDELLAILEKRSRTGYLSPAEIRRAEELKGRRDQLKASIDGANEVLVAKEIGENPDAFEKTRVVDEFAHLIQGQVGVSTFGKSCPDCGRAMVIQWPRADAAHISVDDFFWGCTGWYSNSCHKTIKLSRDDLNIFARIDAPEAQVTQSELTTLVMQPGPTKVVTARMDELMADQRAKRQGANDYCCPDHAEGLRLRQKKEAKGLLDTYFLGCPRWKPDGTGCGYLVKLKSVAQLSMLLARETSDGGVL